MPLLELPTELLDVIIEQTRPRGFEAIALTCRTTYNVAKAYIKEHEELKRKYRQLYVSGDYEVSNNHRDVLLELLQNPVAASYVEDLELNGPITGLDSPSPAHERDRDIQAVQRVFEQFSHWPRRLRLPREQVEEYCAFIVGADHRGDFLVNLCAGLLLFITPNVRTLTLPRVWGRIDLPSDPPPPRDDRPMCDLWHILDQLSPPEHSKGSHTTTTTSPLNKLRTILPHARIEYDSHPRNSLMELLPFMELPSVQEIYTTDCIAVDDSYTGIPFTWRHPHITSNLRILELAGCCIDGDGIGNLLPYTPQLETLRYSHHTKWHGCEHDWDAAHFIHTISQYLGSTLLNLAVTIDSLFGAVIHGVTSMHSFTALRSLELDLAVFSGPALDSGDSQGNASKRCFWKLEDVPPLDEILPSTIDEVYLHVSIEAGNLDRAKDKLLTVGRLFAKAPLWEAAEKKEVEGAPKVTVHCWESEALRRRSNYEEIAMGVQHSPAVHDSSRAVRKAVQTAGARWVLALSKNSRWRQTFQDRFGYLF